MKLKLNETEKEIKKYQLAIIDKLLKQTQDISFNNNLYSRDQIFALNFISTDQTLHFAVPCIKKDLFVDVEKKLYDNFPEFKETNNNFLVEGKIILRFKTLEENRLKSGIPILIVKNQNN